MESEAEYVKRIIGGWRDYERKKREKEGSDADR
jgi:hypothetical protein